MNFSLIHNAKVISAAPAAAVASASEQAHTAIDTTGYGAITFICKSDAVTTTTWQVKSSATSGGSYTTTGLTAATATTTITTEAQKPVMIRVDLSKQTTGFAFYKLHSTNSGAGSTVLTADAALQASAYPQPETQVDTAVDA